MSDKKDPKAEAPIDTSQMSLDDLKKHMNFLMMMDPHLALSISIMYVESKIVALKDILVEKGIVDKDEFHKKVADYLQQQQEAIEKAREQQQGEQLKALLAKIPNDGMTEQ